MNMSVVFGWLAIALGFVIALPSLWMCCEALWPERSRLKNEVALTGLWKSLLIGIVPFVLSVFLLNKLGKAGLAGVIPMGLVLLWGFIGASGLASAIGARLWPYLAADRPWKQTMRGGFVLAGAALLPVVGWFFVLPFILILGWGISVRARFHKKQPPPLQEVGSPVAA
jgi:hypothetical protein